MEQLEQLTLFDMGVVEMAKIRARRAELAAAAVKSPATVRAYDSDWKRFVEWCARAGRPSLPASADTVSLYLADVVTANQSAHSASRYATAINHFHIRAGKPSPVGQEVRDVLKGARRKFGTASPGAKTALTPDELRQICRKMMDSGEPGAIRDRALLVIGFATALRRSELAALNLADITILPRRRLVVRVRRAKNDQLGRGREIGLFPGKHAETCPARALQAWIKFRGKEPGALFTRFACDGSRTSLRLSAQSVGVRVQAAVASIGLDPALYGGHSLRAGCVTAAYEAGAPDSAIMTRSGHRSHASMRKYQRSGNLFAFNPLAPAL